MDVQEIIKEYLKDNKYDGLYNEEGQCACELPGLQPCGENFSDCIPGIKKTWDELTEDQQSACESGCDFYIINKEQK